MNNLVIPQIYLMTTWTVLTPKMGNTVIDYTVLIFCIIELDHRKIEGLRDGLCCLRPFFANKKRQKHS